MPNIINNTNLDKIQNTIESGQKDKQLLKKSVKLQGQWNFDIQKGYQFKTELSYEQGKQIIEIDSPSFLGGNGNRLGPMGYCVAGITSCFIATFVSIISTQGIKLEKLNVNAECNINFAKTFDVADEPITEGINFEIDVRTAVDKEVDKQKLQELVKMAEDRCPAIYSMSHVINVNAKIK
ncbi:MAG TPA: OsmC family protein [Verrucomicrobiae bacterium]|nr:OsmC family protein [Candidatus Sulfopaludibacter sp.]HXT84875.1 OsmC family protein [Verrucomicrobiae bacterium]